MTLHDAFGTLGALLIVGTYLLLQFDRLDPKRAAYSLLNAIGAGLIIISLTRDFNLSAFLVEAFWLLVSIAGLVRLRMRASVQGAVDANSGDSLE